MPIAARGTRLYNLPVMTCTAPVTRAERARTVPAFRAGLAALGLAVAGITAAATPAETSRVSLNTLTPVPQGADSLAGPNLPLADQVVVRKGLRRLYLMRGSTVLRSYRVALGLHPYGQKERSGDYRTPEGRYQLTRRNPRSDYFLSIQVSYPNRDDAARARRRHWDAGGSIMIHGLPNQLSRSPEYYDKVDWTDGCIAVSNADMIEIWLMTAENTPIEILP